MKKERQTIQLLIDSIQNALDDLTSADEINEFQRGQLYAYVECLEILQLYPKSSKLGIDYDIETKFPLK